MLLSGVVIFIVVALAYIWGSRGFFSSLLHLACVLVAGAIAFALWEPISYWILKSAGTNQFLIGLAWGAGLAVPFAVSLIVIRIACDKLVPANCDLDAAPNLLGGIACGAVSGTITAGIMVIALSFLAVAPGFGMLTAVKQEANGAPVIHSRLLYPADRLTAWLYGYAGEATLRSDTPLAKFRPDVTVDGALLRTNFNEGGSRHTLVPKAFSLTQRFTVGKSGKLKVAELMNDGFDAKEKLTSTTLHGEEISPNSTDYYIEGFVVSFNTSAREKEGAVVIGNTQVELVCRNADDTESASYFPIAVSSKAEPTDAEDKKIHYGRWRYERPDTYFRSVGGTADALMGFEFLVPHGSTPLALYVKGVRVDLTRVSEASADRNYADVQERDKAIQKGTTLGGEPGTPGLLVWATSAKRKVVINPEATDNFATQVIRVANSVPGNKSTFTILNKDGIGNLKLNDERQIVSGEEKYRISDLSKNRGIDSKLQVRQFFDGDGTVIVQVDFSYTSEVGPVQNPAANEATGDIKLKDERGETYPCIGFVYYDNQLAHIRFTPENPVGPKEQLPGGGPSASRPDQAFTLLFRVGRAVNLSEIMIGDTSIADIKPHLTIKR